MTLGCKYDIGDCTSDCKNEGCLKTASDEVCDSACNISYCGYDYGDCGYCAPGCTLAMLLDNICQPECNTFECDYDNYRCDCNTGCTYTMLGDKICQMECNIYECGYDRLDCNTYECNPGCSLDLM